MLKQKGGIKIKDGYTPETAFKYFIEHSRTEVLTWNTTGGILFKSTLNTSIASPYISSRSNNPEKDVPYILFKLCLINRNNTAFIIRSRSDANKIYISLNGTTAPEFLKEIQIQLDIFNKSMDEYLEPICPSVVYARIYRSNNEKKSFIDLLLNSNPRVRDPITNQTSDRIRNMKYILQEVFENDLYKQQHPDQTPQVWFQYGIVVMEFLNDYVTVKSLINNNAILEDNKTFYKQLVMYEIWRLYNIGYIHGDLHLYNAMIDLNYDYIKGNKGRVILIDFGDTFLHGKHIPRSSSDIVAVINTVRGTNTPRFSSYLSADGSTPFINSEWHSYKWLNQNETPTDILTSLCQARDVLKQEFIQHVSRSTGTRAQLVQSRFYLLPPTITGGSIQRGNNSNKMNDPNRNRRKMVDKIHTYDNNAQSPFNKSILNKEINRYIKKNSRFPIKKRPLLKGRVSNNNYIPSTNYLDIDDEDDEDDEDDDEDDEDDEYDEDDEDDEDDVDADNYIDVDDGIGYNNIFDILDPNNIFKTDYITNYLHDSNQYNVQNIQILEELKNNPRLVNDPSMEGGTIKNKTKKRKPRQNKYKKSNKKFNKKSNKNI